MSINELSVIHVIITEDPTGYNSPKVIQFSQTSVNLEHLKKGMEFDVTLPATEKHPDARNTRKFTLKLILMQPRCSNCGQMVPENRRVDNYDFLSAEVSEKNK